MTTNTPAFSAPRHIDLVETAKLIRRHLTDAFPGQKFSVRTERFSMGTAANVSWTDGPTVAQVEAITDPFASSGFDGSIDMSYVVSSWYCSQHGASIRHTAGTEGQRGYVSSIDDASCCLGAEPVLFGTKFVSAARTLSDDFRALLMNDLEVALGVEVVPRSTLQAYVTRDGHIGRCEEREYVGTLVHQLAASTSVTPEREIVRVAS
jgi:hypothetical protein